MAISEKFLVPMQLCEVLSLRSEETQSQIESYTFLCYGKWMPFLVHHLLYVGHGTWNSKLAWQNQLLQNPGKPTIPRHCEWFCIFFFPWKGHDLGSLQAQVCQQKFCSFLPWLGGTWSNGPEGWILSLGWVETCPLSSHSPWTPLLWDAIVSLCHTWTAVSLYVTQQGMAWTITKK